MYFLLNMGFSNVMLVFRGVSKGNPFCFTLLLQLAVTGLVVNYDAAPWTYFANPFLLTHHLEICHAGTAFGGQLMKS